MMGAAKMMDIKLVITPKGIAVIHVHPERVKRDAGIYNDDIPWFIGWVRLPCGYWAQYHIAAYGVYCPECKRLCPRNEVLEEIYQKAISDGNIEKIEKFGF
jgi:hypothetical protein